MALPVLCVCGGHLYTPAILALEDGSIFQGYSIGAQGQSVAEVVFNTAMTGYQEILTDPSYAKQIVTLTYPHIGNTGTNSEDEEASRIFCAGLVIRDLSLLASNFRNRQPLDAYLLDNNVVAVAGIDTRKLTRILREKGVQSGCIATCLNPQQAVQAARGFAGLQGMDLAREVSTLTAYTWQQGSWSLTTANPGGDGAEQARFHVVAYDFGAKRNILRILVDYGCRVTVVPAQTSVVDVLALRPDGVFLSNGPGDPEPCDYAIAAIGQILAADIPVFGICLGHQLLGLACGAKTMKMKFGHHGANHPVQNLMDGTVMISSQNHGFSIDEYTLPPTVTATHRSLFDGSLQGIECTDKRAFGFQGHPEASPGPHDGAPLFRHFIDMMETK